LFHLKEFPSKSLHKREAAGVNGIFQSYTGI
jgi:hypothetical protein